MVRLYRNYDPALEQGPVQLVSSFQALGEVVKVKRGSGLVLDWRQMGGNLLAGGDSRVIRLWDAHTESQLVVSPSAQNDFGQQNSPELAGLGYKFGEPSNVDHVRPRLIVDLHRELRRRRCQGL